MNIGRAQVLASAAAVALGVFGGVSQSVAAIDVLYVESMQTAYWATSAVRDDMPIEISYWQASPLAYQGYSASRVLGSSREISADPGQDIASDSIASGAPSQSSSVEPLQFSSYGRAYAQTVYGASETGVEYNAVYSGAGTTFLLTFDVTEQPEPLFLTGSLHADAWQDLFFRFVRVPIAGGDWDYVPGHTPVSILYQDGTLLDEDFDLTINDEYTLLPGYRYQLELRSVVEASAWADGPEYSAESWFNVTGVVPEPSVLGIGAGSAMLLLIRRRRERSSAAALGRVH